MPLQSITAPVTYKVIPGWPAYRVGDDGSIWSRYRRGVRGRLASDWRQLSPRLGTNTGRYLVALFSGDGVRKMVSVHRLVMLAFVGPCPDGMEVCHNNGDSTDNRLSNLRYDTHIANVADTVIHGTSNQGSRNGSAKLTEDMVREIRHRCEWGELQRSVAKSLGVTQSTVSQIVTRKIWNHVSDD